MRKSCVLFCFAVMVFLASALAQADLVQRLRFEGDLTDSVGSYDMGGTATGISYPSASTNGNHWEGDSAVAFDGATGRGWIPADANLNGSDFTLMYWMAPHAEHPSISSVLTGTDTFTFETMFSVPNGNTIWIHQWDATEHWTNTGYVATPGVWHHLAFAYESATNTLRFYANGQLAWEDTLPASANLAGSTFHHIASDNWGLNLYKGRMDDYRMYNEALSAEAIGEIIAPGGLVQRLEFDGNWNDSLYNQPIAPLNATTTLTMENRVGTGSLALRNSQDGGYIERKWGGVATTTFTQMYWVKIPSTVTNAGAARMTATPQYALETAFLNDWQFAFFNNDNGTEGWQYTGFAPERDKWYHLAWAYNGTTMTLLVNGSETWSQTQAVPINRSDDYWFHIGYANGPAEYFNGNIDDYRLYNRAVSGSEILAMYPPDGATPISPADGSLAVGPSASLQWESAALASEYHVYLSETSPLQPGDLLTTTAATQVVPGGLQAAKTYYWRVDALNAAGLTTGTEVSFSTVSEMPASDLLLHLTFDGHFADSSSYGNDASAMGDAQTTETAIVGAGCLLLDGNGDYLTVPYDASMEADSFSMMAWVNAEETSVTWFQRVWGHENYAFDASVHHDMTLFYPASTGWSGYRGVVPDGQWTHLAYLVDSSGTSQTVQVYVNGREAGSFVSDSGSTISRTNKMLAIGADYLGGGNYGGRIDDLRLYSRLLTPFELSLIANNPLPAAVPDRQWMFFD